MLIFHLPEENDAQAGIVMDITAILVRLLGGLTTFIAEGQWFDTEGDTRNEEHLERVRICIGYIGLARPMYALDYDLISEMCEMINRAYALAGYQQGEVLVIATPVSAFTSILPTLGPR